jgi:hypothetical protein
VVTINRYPVEMHKYAQSTGALLAHRIGRIFSNIGFASWVVKGQNNGIDIKVYRNGTLIIVCEVLNWSPYTRLSNRRKRRIIRNLTQQEYANASKLLIYTTMKDENQLNDLWQYGILKLKIGNQVLPRYFYNFYSAKKQTESRKIDSKETTDSIKEKLTAYTQTLNPQTYPKPIELTIN